MKTAKDVLIEGLKAMGADGLCMDGCGCGLDDPMPGLYCAIEYCVPARKVPVPEEHRNEFDEWYEPVEVTTDGYR